MNILENLTILYVEDEELAREEVADFLEFEVKEVVVAENGKDGLEKFKNNNIDIVVTDINMPVMNGLEMAKEIKKISPKIPIIVTSAYSDSDFIIKAIEIGISRYVLKPIDVDELLTMIMKSAKELIFEDTISMQNEYIKFLIDTNPAFMLVFTNKEMEHINSKFLDFLGYKNEEEFLKAHKNSDEFKPIVEVIEDIMKDKKGKYLTIKKNGIKEQFLVQYREFPKMNKNIFIFSKVTQEDKIKMLCNKIKNYCPKELQKEIEEIL